MLGTWISIVYCNFLTKDFVLVRWITAQQQQNIIAIIHVTNNMHDFIYCVCVRKHVLDKTYLRAERVWWAQPTSKPKIYHWLDGVRREDQLKNIVIFIRCCEDHNSVVRALYNYMAAQKLIASCMSLWLWLTFLSIGLAGLVEVVRLFNRND